MPSAPPQSSEIGVEDDGDCDNIDVCRFVTIHYLSSMSNIPDQPGSDVDQMKPPVNNALTAENVDIMDSLDRVISPQFSGSLRMC